MMPKHVCAEQAMWRYVPPAALALSSCMAEYGLNEAPADGPFSGRTPTDERDFQVLRGRLDGAMILVVEDEAIVAMDIRFALNDAGADVLGPAASLSDALALAQNALRIDAAILDIDLGGEDVFRLADLLASRSVPFLFHTGGPDIADIETRYPDAALLRKPVAVDDLLLSLAHRMR